MPRRTVQTPVRLVLMNRRPTSPCLEEAAEGKNCCGADLEWLSRSEPNLSHRDAYRLSDISAVPAPRPYPAVLLRSRSRAPRSTSSNHDAYVGGEEESGPRHSPLVWVSLRDMHEYPHSGRTVVDSHETPHTPAYRQPSIASRTPRLAHQLSIIQTHQRRCSSYYPITHLQSCTCQGQIPKLCMTLLRGRCGRVSR
ncbi:hypothetical protein C8F04DRAFT_1125377 [Mycena alexandri]|uniref:Uncharacterized protein n=1 Tax=Mycena alexandri TaxID=1745969 RepID=A0AAD6WZ82_9AGAR|nr:hypothetical protein C8F04DRAFT_1125377 [Mycena alexandri]